MSKDMPQGKQTVSDEEIVESIKSHDDPFVRADEVGQLHDHTRQWAHNRLQQLHESGQVAKKSSGRAAIWWVCED